MGEAGVVMRGGGDGRGQGWGGGGRFKNRRGEKGEKKESYTQIRCMYFVVQVATSPCTAVKPEVDVERQRGRQRDR